MNHRATPRFLVMLPPATGDRSATLSVDCTIRHWVGKSGVDPSFRTFRVPPGPIKHQDEVAVSLDGDQFQFAVELVLLDFQVRRDTFEPFTPKGKVREVKVGFEVVAGVKAVGAD